MDPLALDATPQLVSEWDKVVGVATAAYALAAWVAGVAAIAAFVIIRKQLRAADQTRRLKALNDVYEQFHTDASKADRSDIYNSQLNSFDNSDFEGLWRQRAWKGVELQRVEHISDQMHFIGLLVDSHLVDVDDLFEYFMWPALLSYRHMARYLYWVRDHYNPRYAEHFISLIPKLETRFKDRYGTNMFRERFGVDSLINLGRG